MSNSSDSLISQPLFGQAINVHWPPATDRELGYIAGCLMASLMYMIDTWIVYNPPMQSHVFGPSLLTTCSDINTQAFSQLVSVGSPQRKQS